MSQRFLKYETEAGNPMVDENGLLLAGGSGNKKRIEILNNTTLSTFDQEPSGDYTKYIYVENNDVIVPSLSNQIHDGSFWKKYRMVILLRNIGYGYTSKTVLEFNEFDESYIQTMSNRAAFAPTHDIALINVYGSESGEVTLIFASKVAPTNYIISAYIEEL